MSSIDDKTIAIARVYSEALLSLARSQGREEGFHQELHELVDLQERDPAVADLLNNPLIEPRRRRASLERAFRNRASDLLVDTLQVLNTKGRLRLLPAIAHTYEEALDQLEARVDVRLVSAIPLTDLHREQIRSAIHRSTGQQARLSERVDPSLLGGMVIQIGDRKADASVTTQLRVLSDALMARASRQILSGAHVE